MGTPETSCLELIGCPGQSGEAPSPQPLLWNVSAIFFLTLLVTAVHSINLFCVTVVSKASAHTDVLG